MKQLLLKKLLARTAADTTPEVTKLRPEQQQQQQRPEQLLLLLCPPAHAARALMTYVLSLIGTQPSLSWSYAHKHNETDIAKS
jgi:hypothetical protein